MGIVQRLPHSLVDSARPGNEEPGQAAGQPRHGRLRTNRRFGRLSPSRYAAVILAGACGTNAVSLISRDPGRGPIAVFFDFGVVNLDVPIKGEVKQRIRYRPLNRNTPARVFTRRPVSLLANLVNDNVVYHSQNSPTCEIQDDRRALIGAAC
jgi:hypothetical protein